MLNLSLRSVIALDHWLDQHRPEVLGMVNALARAEDGEVLACITPTTEIPRRYAFILWAISAIVRRGIIPPNHIRTVVDVFPGELIRIAERFELEMRGTRDAALTPAVITLAERRLVGITGTDQLFDLLSCDLIESPPVTFEGVSYNLAVPVRHSWTGWCLKYAVASKGAKNGPQRKNESDSPQHGDAGSGTAGDSGGPPRP